MADHTRLSDADLEQLLAEHVADVAYPHFNDISASVDQRLAQAGSANGARSTNRQRSTMPENGDVRLVDNGRPPQMIGSSEPSIRRRQVVELAAGLLVFAIVGSALLLIFRGIGPGSNDASGLGVTGETTAAYHLLHVEATPDVLGLLARPVDPTTLEPLPAHGTINLGHHYTHAFSPDGQTMAVFSWPSGSSNRGGELLLVDLVAWTVAKTGIEVNDVTPGLLFSPDGNALYWTLPTATHPAHGMPRDYELYRWDLTTSTQATVARLPESFSPSDLRLFEDGTRMAIWGVPVDPNNIVEGPPRVMIVDLEQDAIVADVELPGVKAGQHQEMADSSVVNRIYRPGLAWDIERGLLYVVHADEDWITVVDLRAAAVKVQSPITEPQSLVDRFFDWLVPSAVAKGVPTTAKQAVLSADGRRLFITSTIENPRAVGAREELGASTAEVVIVETENFEETGRFDLGTIVSMQPTLDRRYLIVRSYTDSAFARGHRLTKLDMASNEIVAQVDLPEQHGSGCWVTDKAVIVRIYESSLGETTRAEEIRVDLESFQITHRTEVSGPLYLNYLQP